MHGSLENTSRPAARTWPLRTASASAASSTRPPRAALTMMTPGLVFASASLPIQSGRFGRLGQVHRDEVGAAQQFVQRQQLDTQLRGAGRGHVGVIGDQVGAEGAEPLGNQLPDPAQPDDADRLAEDLGARERRSLPGVLVQRGVGGRDLTGRGQQQRQRVLGGAVDVRRRRVDHQDTALGGGVDVDVVQADPARATIFSLGPPPAPPRRRWWPNAPAASASGTAASSFSRSGPSTQRTSTWSPRAATVDSASLSAMSTTGRFTRPAYRL